MKGSANLLLLPFIEDNHGSILILRPASMLNGWIKGFLEECRIVYGNHQEGGAVMDAPGTLKTLYIWLHHQPLKESYIIHDHHLYFPCQQYRPALQRRPSGLFVDTCSTLYLPLKCRPFHTIHYYGWVQF